MPVTEPAMGSAMSDIMPWKTELPWKTEPSKEEFDHNGLPCLIIRHDTFLTLNGYVGVRSDHPMYGLDYTDTIWVDSDKFPNLVPNEDGSIRGGDLLCPHGGVTFTGTMFENHDLWWFGFDCSHAYDFKPGVIDTPMESLNMTGSHYRDIEYVRNECRMMAERLSSLDTCKSS